jgi:hypothetical protein
LVAWWHWYEATTCEEVSMGEVVAMDPVIAGMPRGGPERP